MTDCLRMFLAWSGMLEEDYSVTPDGGDFTLAEHYPANIVRSEWEAWRACWACRNVPALTPREKRLLASQDPRWRTHFWHPDHGFSETPAFVDVSTGQLAPEGILVPEYKDMFPDARWDPEKGRFLHK